MATSARKGTKAAKGRQRAPSRKQVALKFRVEPERAAVVSRIARAEGRTESDVLREGIDLVERVHARRENLPRLAEFIKEIPPEHRRR